VNGDKTDNRPENLQVLSREVHKKLHNDEIAEKLQRLAEYERRFGPLTADDGDAAPCATTAVKPTRIM
jgi:hypothetical protein